MAEDVEAGAGPGAAWVSRLVLAPDPRSVREARAFVRTCCQDAGIAGDLCEIAVLLTSETVTNALIHGRSKARLAVTARADSLLVEVGDDDSQAPEPVEQHPDAVGGRGLLILDTLADSWGARDDQHGKLVWFEVRTPQTLHGPRPRPARHHAEPPRGATVAADAAAARRNQSTPGTSTGRPTSTAGAGP